MSKTKKYAFIKKQYIATLYKYKIYITWYKYVINILYITIYNPNYGYYKYSIYIMYITYIHICI